MFCWGGIFCGCWAFKKGGGFVGGGFLGGGCFFFCVVGGGLDRGGWVVGVFSVVVIFFLSLPLFRSLGMPSPSTAPESVVDHICKDFPTSFV